MGQNPGPTSSAKVPTIRSTLAASPSRWGDQKWTEKNEFSWTSNTNTKNPSLKSSEKGFLCFSQKRKNKTPYLFECTSSRTCPLFLFNHLFFDQEPGWPHRQGDKTLLVRCHFTSLRGQPKNRWGHPPPLWAPCGMCGTPCKMRRPRRQLGRWKGFGVWKGEGNIDVLWGGTLGLARGDVFAQEEWFSSSFKTPWLLWTSQEVCQFGKWEARPHFDTAVYCSMLNQATSKPFSWRPAAESTKKHQANKVVCVNRRQPENQKKNGRFFVLFLQIPAMGRFTNWPSWPVWLAARSEVWRVSKSKSLQLFASLLYTFSKAFLRRLSERRKTPSHLRHLRLL